MNKILLLCMLFVVFAIPVSAANTVSIGDHALNKGESKIVPIMLNDATDIWAVNITLSFNSSAVNVTTNLSDAGNFTYYAPLKIDNNTIKILAANGFGPNNSLIGLNGNQTIGYVNLKAEDCGASTLDIKLNELITTSGIDIASSATVNDGSVTVSGCGTPTPIQGDLNGNGISADAGDLILMKRASVGEIMADSGYDLNNNGQISDAGDLVLMKRASIGEIILTWNDRSITAAQPVATNFGVKDATGNLNTFVEVPVNITNVQNDSIAGIIFDITFDPSVLNLTRTNVKKGSLTSAWDLPSFNPANGLVSIVYAGSGTEIPVGASGSVVILNFSVVGAPGTQSAMNISRIQLSNLSGNVGTATSINGTFMVLGGNVTPTATITPKVTVTPTPGKITICHIPTGNPKNRYTITVGASSVKAHLNHGDILGPCATPTPTVTP